jgi:hypothetical protein
MAIRRDFPLELAGAVRPPSITCRKLRIGTGAGKVERHDVVALRFKQWTNQPPC